MNKKQGEIMRRDKKGHFRAVSLLDKLIYSRQDMQKWGLLYEAYKGNKDAAKKIILSSTAEEIKGIIKALTLLEEILYETTLDLFNDYLEHTGEYDEDEMRCPFCKHQK